MSAILSAETLNDFIAPSIACIKPVESLPPPPTSSSELSVAVEDDKAPSDAKTAAQISLTDCLACSGCVTSSEAVLVQMQSHNEVLGSLNQFPEKMFVALLSPQTRAALAVALKTTENEAANMVARLLTSELARDGMKGFEAVLDTNPFRRLAHYYTEREVHEEHEKKPILASSCPGFICYLESTHPELIPHLSTLKSPQAIAGTFVKSLLIGEGRVKSPEDVYVVSIMPCFDKKLEGARSELMSSAWRGKGVWGETPVRDVDCVITTRELLSLAEAKGVDFAGLGRAPVSIPAISADPTVRSFLSATSKNVRKDTGTSGGSLAALISALLEQNPDATLSIQQGRNVDTVDYLILAPSGETITKLSRCYGFRNIQNLVRRLKPSKARVMPQFGNKKPAVATPAAGRRMAAKRAGEAKDDKVVYVEVMACPGGCTNGGGQIKWDDESLWKELGLDKWASQRELLAKVDEAYFSSSEASGELSENGVKGKRENDEDIRQAIQAWSRISGVSEDLLIKTTYRRVANDVGGRLGEKEVLELASRTGGGW